MPNNKVPHKYASSVPLRSSPRFSQRFEIFTWRSPDDETELTFAVTPLLSALKRGVVPYDLVHAILDREWAATWLVQRDLNLSFVKRLAQNRPARYYDPVLGITMKNGSVLLIDGSHRYMAHYLNGEETIDYHIIPHGSWSSFANTTKGNPDNVPNNT
jgi:hypothetical protein